MASSISSDAAHGSDNGLESRTSTSTFSADDATHFSYRNGDLTWSGAGGSDGQAAGGKIKGEEVLFVTENKGSDGAAGYTIFSLTSIDTTDVKKLPLELKATSASTLPKECLDNYLFRGLPTYLRPAEAQIYVLVSTLSGTGLAPDFYDIVLHRILEAIGVPDSSYTLIRTNSAHSVREFASKELLQRANEGKKQSVLMLSGDGGVVDTINGLLESGDKSQLFTKPTLAQLPLGTGNALFHSLHRPSPLPSIYIQGLRTLLHGTPRPLPLFRARFSPGSRTITNEGQTTNLLSQNLVHGAVVASYGLHATLVADSDTVEYRKHGDKRFGLVAGDLLFPKDGAMPHKYKAKVTLFRTSGEEYVVPRKEHGYVLSSLVSNLEKTFTISPASKPLDGELRVVHFGAASGKQTMKVMEEAYKQGAHVGKGEVGYEAMEKLRIDFEEEGEDWKWRRCCVDGLIVGVEEGGWMEVQRLKGDETLDVVVDL
ncbi:glycogen synthase kinase mutation revertant protein [Rutstroemia sp. NJR-2017a BBW]|nr:glycogen synthase kinase mutation revertant protein [Rutstroemia sp. NJR-2017a BBW]